MHERNTSLKTASLKRFHINALVHSGYSTDSVGFLNSFNLDKNSESSCERLTVNVDSTFLQQHSSYVAAGLNYCLVIRGVISGFLYPSISSGESINAEHEH